MHTHKHYNDFLRVSIDLFIIIYIFSTAISYSTFLFLAGKCVMHVPHPGERAEGSVGSYRLKTCGVPKAPLCRSYGCDGSRLRDPGSARSAPHNADPISWEDVDRPLDISPFWGARVRHYAPPPRVHFVMERRIFPKSAAHGHPSPSLGRIHGRVWEQTHTRSNSPATPPTIFYRGCLPAAPHASRATGPLGGLRLCPTETGVTVRPAADRFLLRGAIRPDGFGPRRHAGRYRT